MTETDVVNFAGLSGDSNPVHVVAEYARTTRFGQRVPHGLLTASNTWVENQQGKRYLRVKPHCGFQRTRVKV